MPTYITLIALAALFVNQQTQQGQVPQFKAPPGYEAKVQSVSHSYNFYPLKRDLPIQFDQIAMPPSTLSKGISVSKTFSCPSATAEKFYNNSVSAMPSFGTPSRKGFQAFVGQGADGIVIFYEYSHVLPMDAKEQLSKYFFKSTVPPNPTDSKAIEQFLVTDHIVVVWCFRNPKSKAKEDHQTYIFNMISGIGQKMQQKK
jgi:hypothetical protein